MIAKINGDIVIGKMKGNITGVPIPSELLDLPAARLRFDGINIVDAKEYNQFYIDADGIKHIVDDGSWQALMCSFDDVLIWEDDIWRIETDADILTAAKAAAITGTVTAADRFTASILGKYPEAERAAWPQKQAESAIIIVADDASTSITTAINKTVLMKTIAGAAGWDNAATVVAAKAIIIKANEFAAIAAMVEVMRSTAELAINAAVDINDLEAVKSSLSEQAQTLAAQYGLV